MEDHRVEHFELGEIRANAERDHRDGAEGEARRSPQHAPTIPEILRELI